MSKATAANPVCSRTGTTQVAATPGSATISIAVDPVCRYVAATQTTIPDASN